MQYRNKNENEVSYENIVIYLIFQWEVIKWINSDDWTALYKKASLSPSEYYF